VKCDTTTAPHFFSYWSLAALKRGGIFQDPTRRWGISRDFLPFFQAKNFGDTAAERFATRRGVLKKGPKGANSRMRDPRPVAGIVSCRNTQNYRVKDRHPQGRTPPWRGSVELAPQLHGAQRNRAWSRRQRRGTPRIGATKQRRIICL